MIAMARQPVECKLVPGVAETSSITKKSQVPPGGATTTGIDQGQRGTERDWEGLGEMRDGRWQMAAGNPGQLLNGLGGFVDLVGRGGGATRWEGTMKTIIA